MSATNGVHTTNGVHVNGSTASRPLTAGIFAPIPTFFVAETEELDLAPFTAHIVRLAKAGVRPVLAGSMGEAHHLSHSERITLIKAARKALDDAGFTQVPIIAGTGAGSTRETIELCKEASDAGADYAITICSGYFAGAIANDKAALKAFWTDVAAASPIPVMIYNYPDADPTLFHIYDFPVVLNDPDVDSDGSFTADPGAAGGIDLDSDLITELATECPNLCGVKLTCGNVGKLTRICATVSDASFAAQHPRVNAAAPFLVLGGFIDFVLPTAFVNAHGAITGLGNVAPYTIQKLFEVSEAALKDPSLLPEAQRLQGIVARADFTIAKTGIAGTKFLLEKIYGYGGVPRRPLAPTQPEAAAALWAHPHTQDIVREERELSGKVVA